MTSKSVLSAILVVLTWAPSAYAQTYSLSEALQTAVQRAPQRAAARSATQASESAAAVDRAGLFPQLVTNAGARYSQPISRIDLPVLPAPIELGTAWNASVGLTAQWRVVDVGRWASLDADASRVDAAKSDADSATIETEKVVRDVYLTAAYMSEVVLATQASREAMSKTLEELQAQLDAGLTSEVDVANAKARLAEVDARLVEAKTRRASALASLRVMMGLPQSASIELSDSVEDIAAIAAGAGKGEHPKLMSLRNSASAAEFDASAAMRRWWPTLDVFVTGEYRYPKTMVDDTAGFGWMAGAQLQWLIFDGGLRTAAHHAQASRASVLQHSAQAAAEQLEIERADANARIASADASLHAVASRLAAAEAFAALTRVALEAGTGNDTDVIDADVQVDQARLAKVTATYQLALAKSMLWRATGVKFTSEE